MQANPFLLLAIISSASLNAVVYPPKTMVVEKVGDISLIFASSKAAQTEDKDILALREVAEASARVYNVNIKKLRVTCEKKTKDFKRVAKIESEGLKLEWSEELIDDATRKDIARDFKAGKCSNAKPEIESQGRSNYNPDFVIDAKVPSWNAFIVHDKRIIGYANGKLYEGSGAYVNMVELAEEYKGYALKRFGKVKPGLCQVLTTYAFQMLKKEHKVERITLSNFAGIAGCLCYSQAAAEAGFTTFVGDEKKPLADPQSACLKDAPLKMLFTSTKESKL